MFSIVLDDDDDNDDNDDKVEEDVEGQDPPRCRRLLPPVTTY